MNPALYSRKGFLDDLNLHILPIYKRHERTFDHFLVHGRLHICRSIIFAESMANYLQKQFKLKPDYFAIRYAVAFHDSGRKGNGKDIWEEESFKKCFHYVNEITNNQEYAQYVAGLILKTDDFSDLNKRIVYDSDVLEITRTFSGDKGVHTFRKDYLYFLSENDPAIVSIVNKDKRRLKHDRFRDAFIEESWRWILDTEKIAIPLSLADDIMERLLKHLKKNKKKFPKISKLI